MEAGEGERRLDEFWRLENALIGGLVVKRALEEERVALGTAPASSEFSKGPVSVGPVEEEIRLGASRIGLGSSSSSSDVLDSSAPAALLLSAIPTPNPL